MRAWMRTLGSGLERAGEPLSLTAYLRQRPRKANAACSPARCGRRGCLARHVAKGSVTRTCSDVRSVPDQLGLSSVGDTALAGRPLRQVRLRDFEVPMSGGFYMLEYVEEIQDFFVPGTEIVCFDGRADLVDKCRYYLENETERRLIAQAGHRRARQDHTWQRRLSDAFQEMGLEHV